MAMLFHLQKQGAQPYSQGLVVLVLFFLRWTFDFHRVTMQ